MAKELPYYQFEPAEYMTGDILFCSYKAQGIFHIICCIYWQKSCTLELHKIQRRFKNETEALDELLNDEIIKVDSDGFIEISFLDKQYEEISGKSKDKSKSGIIGNLKRWHIDIYNRFISKEITFEDAVNESKVSHTDSTPIANGSQSIADKIREDDIREDKKKEDDTIEILSEFDFSIFWDLYDKKVGDKDKIKKQYNNLTEEVKSNIFKHVEQYKLSQPDKSYRKNPTTYLNQKAWNDELIFKQTPKANNYGKEDNNISTIDRLKRIQDKFHGTDQAI